MNRPRIGSIGTHLSIRILTCVSAILLALGMYAPPAVSKEDGPPMTQLRVGWENKEREEWINREIGYTEEQKKSRRSLTREQKALKAHLRLTFRTFVDSKQLTRLDRALHELCPCLFIHVIREKKQATQWGYGKGSIIVRRPDEMTDVPASMRKGKFEGDISQKADNFCNCYKLHRAGCNLLWGLARNTNGAHTTIRLGRSASTRTKSDKAGRNKHRTGNIAWNPVDMDSDPSETGQKERPVSIGLGHELVHAWNYVSGNKKTGDIEELNAGAAENQLRAEMHEAAQRQIDGKKTYHEFKNPKKILQNTFRRPRYSFLVFDENGKPIKLSKDRYRLRHVAIPRKQHLPVNQVIPMPPEPPVSIEAEKKVKQGDPLRIGFTGSTCFDESAWIGIVPAAVRRGSEAESEQGAVWRKTIGPSRGDELVVKKKLPDGRYQVRIYDNDEEGNEAAVFDFEVGKDRRIGKAPAQESPQQALAAVSDGTWYGSDGREYLIQNLPGGRISVQVSGPERQPTPHVNTSPLSIHFTGAEIQKGLDYRGTFSASGFQVAARLESERNFHPRFAKSVVREVLKHHPEFSSRMDIVPIDKTTIELTRHLTGIHWKGDVELLEVTETHASERVVLSRDRQVSEERGTQTGGAIEP